MLFSTKLLKPANTQSVSTKPSFKKGFAWLILGSVLASSMVLAGGCSSLQGGGQVVATINNTELKKSDLDQYMNRFSKLMNIQESQLNDKAHQEIAKTFKVMAFQAMVLDALVTQEAEKRHIVVSDDDVNTLYNKTAAQSGGEAKLTEYLRSMGLTTETFKAELKRNLIKDKLVEQLAGNKLAVTEHDAKSFFDKNRANFDVPETVRARHILILAEPGKLAEEFKKADKSITDEALEKKVNAILTQKKTDAETLLAEVKKNPKSFDGLAKQRSEDKGSAAQGGDLGFFPREQMVPEFANAAFGAKPGELVDHVVQTNYGFHIIQVLDRKSAEAANFNAAKPQIMELLQSQRKTDTLNTWLQESRKSAKIVVSPEFKDIQSPDAELVKEAPKK